MGKYYYQKEGSSTYYISKEDYLCAIHYALRYPDLIKKLSVLSDEKGIDYSKVRVKSSNNYNSTQELAIKRAEISKKIKLIDDTIKEVSDGLDYWIRLSVCYGFNFDQLYAKKIPASRATFYRVRKKFYFELIKKI